jgi:hypothetical protein
LTLAITVASGSTPRLPGPIGCLPPWPATSLEMVYEMATSRPIAI